MRIRSHMLERCARKAHVQMCIRSRMVSHVTWGSREKSRIPSHTCRSMLQLQPWNIHYSVCRTAFRHKWNSETNKEHKKKTKNIPNFQDFHGVGVLAYKQTRREHSGACIRVCVCGWALIMCCPGLFLANTESFSRKLQMRICSLPGSWTRGPKIDPRSKRF